MAPEEFDKQFLAWLTRRWEDGGEFRRMARGPEGPGRSWPRTTITTRCIKEGEEVRSCIPTTSTPPTPTRFSPRPTWPRGQTGCRRRADRLRKDGRPQSRTRSSNWRRLRKRLGDPKEAAATLDRINYIYPVNDEELHRHLGDLWFAQNNYPGAIREYAAVVASHPLDKASAQFNLASAYFAAGQRDKAEENVLAVAGGGARLPARPEIAVADSKTPKKGK